jgi:hypothetical protein
VNEIESEKATSTETRPTDWWGELSEGLRWSNERAWPLGGGLLFTAALYLHNFIELEKVPLSIASAAFVTTLPTMLALVVWLVLVLTLAFLMPTIVLFTQLSKNGRTLAELMYPSGRKNGKNSRLTVKLALLWLLKTLFLGLIVGSAIEWLNPSLTSAVVVFLVAPTLVASVWVAFSARQAGINWRETSLGFWAVSFAGTFVQAYILLTVIALLAETASAYLDSFCGRFISVFLIALLVGIVQGAATRLIEEEWRSHDNRIARAAAFGVAIVLLLGLFPPAGGKLAGYALRITASGGRACAILSWPPGFAQANEHVRDPKNSQRSRQLRILAEFDGTYIVRPYGAESKAVGFVSRTNVSGIDQCPNGR